VGKFSKFSTTPAFRRAFQNLSLREKKAAKEAFKLFKADPFDPKLRTHVIKKLSSRLRRTVYAVEILGNLRAVFYTVGETVISFDIGAHDIYK
jgi:hypothetical protein